MVTYIMIYVYDIYANTPLRSVPHANVIYNGEWREEGDWIERCLLEFVKLLVFGSIALVI